MAGTNPSSPTSNLRAQVGGSGVTVVKWNWQGKGAPSVIAFARMISVTAPKAVAPEVDVQPLDHIRPIEVVTAYAQGHGTVQLTLTQIYNQDAWQRLIGLFNAQDFTDVARQVVSTTNPIVIERWVSPPVPNHPQYHELFMNCVLTEIGDDQPVDITTMLLDKTLTFAYAYAKKLYINNGAQLHPNAPLVAAI